VSLKCPDTESHNATSSTSSYENARRQLYGACSKFGREMNTRENLVMGDVMRRESRSRLWLQVPRLPLQRHLRASARFDHSGKSTSAACSNGTQKIWQAVCQCPQSLAGSASSHTLIFGYRCLCFYRWGNFVRPWCLRLSCAIPRYATYYTKGYNGMCSME